MHDSPPIVIAHGPLGATTTDGSDIETTDISPLHK